MFKECFRLGHLFFAILPASGWHGATFALNLSHMTDDPPDPAYRQAAAAYRSAGNLRNPAPAPQIVRLVEQPASQAAQPSQKQPSPEESVRLAETVPGAPPNTPAPAPAGAPAVSPAQGVSLMITSAQKDGLRRLGVSEEEIRDMTPAEAHRRLGLTGR